MLTPIFWTLLVFSIVAFGVWAHFSSKAEATRTAYDHYIRYERRTIKKSTSLSRNQYDVDNSASIAGWIAFIVFGLFALFCWIFIANGTGVGW